MAVDSMCVAVWCGRVVGVWLGAGCVCVGEYACVRVFREGRGACCSRTSPLITENSSSKSTVNMSSESCHPADARAMLARMRRHVTAGLAACSPTLWVGVFALAYHVHLLGRTDQSARKPFPSSVRR